MTFKTTGAGDIDLYVRRGSAPTTSVADCKSEGETAVETCTLTAVSGEKLYWLFYAYAASNGSLTVTAPDAAPPVSTTTTLLAQQSISLDMEIKILGNGHYIFKQVREFHGH